MNWRDAISTATRAPSSHNTQPWRFRVAGDYVDLWLDRSRGLPVADPHGREITMSCGAALAHLELALAHARHGARVSLMPDPGQPDLLARIEAVPERTPTPEEEALFASITDRRTCRKPFASEPLPGELRDALPGIAERTASTRLVEIPREARSRVAELIAEGDRRQWRDRQFRKELSRWMRSNTGKARDGMPGYAFGFGNVASRVTPAAVRFINLGGSQARTDYRLATEAPWVGVLATAADEPRDWIEAGRALASILLRAARDGASASYFNQPIQRAELRPLLRDAAALEGHPQVLFRLGFARPGTPTPRREVDDVTEWVRSDT